MTLLPTIMIPTFNGERFLPRTIESALDQTFEGDYEILIIDDGSQDSTGKIAEEFKRRFPTKVRVLHQENMGNGATRNRLLEESRGEILLGLDHDDLLNPQALERIVEHYDGHPEVGFVYTDSEVIDEEGITLHQGRKGDCHKHFDDLIHFTHFPGHLRTFRKSLLGKARFDPTLELAQDWDFLLQIHPFVKKGHVPEILYSFRINQKGVSRTMDVEEKRRSSVELLKKYIRLHNLYPGVQNIEVVPVAEGEHAIHYEHIVDGNRTLKPEARDVLEKYFSAYKKPLGEQN